MGSLQLKPPGGFFARAGKKLDTFVYLAKMPNMDNNATVDRAKWEARASVLKAMAHPSRLMIVDELSRGERCVADLTALVGSDVSTVSRHLTVLKNAGLLADDKRGNQVFYALRTPCVLNFFSCVEAVLHPGLQTSIERTE